MPNIAGPSQRNPINISTRVRDWYDSGARYLSLSEVGKKSMSLLSQIAVLLAATVIAIPLFRRFRLSSVLGYLAAGIVIGPWGLRLVKDTHGIHDIAEFGVVLLLFVIGLELQPSRLRAMRR